MSPGPERWGLETRLLIDFLLTFLNNYVAQRSPFSTAGRSIVKTVSMCTGELEFDSIFHQEPSGERDELSDVPFPPVSYLLWTAFIIFIPILLINMLVCAVFNCFSHAQTLS